MGDNGGAFYNPALIKVDVATAGETRDGLDGVPARCLSSGSEG